jgi:hypothetical protein
MIVRKIVEKEILVADFGGIKLFRVIEEGDDLLENASK